MLWININEKKNICIKSNTHTRLTDMKHSQFVSKILMFYYKFTLNFQTILFLN